MLRRTTPFRMLSLSALWLLAGCGDNQSGSEVGGVSPSEAQALNDAAEMLYNRAIPAASNGAASVR